MACRSASETSISNDHGLLAKPLHVQRLERAVYFDSFLGYVQNLFSTPLSDLDETTETEAESQSEVDGELNEGKGPNEVLISWQERRADQMRLYNFSKVKKSRKWLKNILLSSESSDSEDDSESVTEEDLQEMLKYHKLARVAQGEYHADPELRQYQYYSSGLLSNHDRFYEHQRLVLGGKKKLKDKKIEKKKSKLKKIKMEKYEKTNLQDYFELNSVKQEERSCKSGECQDTVQQKPISKRKNAAAQEAAMTTKRRRLWVALAKKEVCKAQKQKIAAHKELLTTAKRLAHACQRECRKAAILSQKVMKDTPSRAKRLTKEMMLYWKRYEKVEKEHRKRAEKEAQEQLRMDIELREAKRQQRKLNFLITQTELYAHFMSHKMGGLPDLSEESILSQLDEIKSEPASQQKLSYDDDEYDPAEMKSLALKNAENAYRTHQAHTKAFDNEVNSLKNKKQLNNQRDFNENFRLTNPSLSTDEDLPQPQMFDGKLKTYQLKGMNWLYNLYDKGINGILADEMGLGKTVQTIAFLATLVETQGIWGPFLIIAPASTLHNWQQEFTRFVPKFKVLPYWGNPFDRKILRKFWNQKDLHTSQASFHVLITSYQLVVQDVKYFQRIKWQYMVLDEAQAIKSTTSVRWKILLGFNCRNRLLLSGTPIQNSMAELWALLHFIMPTLFDSHEEFNEWFSKDIESHAENKSTIDEKHLSRLHMILKPFMLRRIKKDVENELSDKIEILMYCYLTQRQKLLYQGLKNKISIEDLMQSSSSTSSQAQYATSSLMNLVMQFRKVCNHPDLFERREVKSPFFMKFLSYVVPRLLFREGFLHLYSDGRKKLLLSVLNIFHPDYVYHSVFPTESSDIISHSDCCFSFIRFIDLSPSEVSKIAQGGILPRWLSCYLLLKSAYRIMLREIWKKDIQTNACKYHHQMLLMPPQFAVWARLGYSALRSLIFTDYCSSVYSLMKITLYYMAETPQHREMRIQKVTSKVASASVTVNMSQSVPTSPQKFHSPPHSSGIVPVFPHIRRPPLVIDCQPTLLPSFMTHICPKVLAETQSLHCCDPVAIRWQHVQKLCEDTNTHALLLHGISEQGILRHKKRLFHPHPTSGILAARPREGWSHIIVPYKESLVTDSGKLKVLDELLKKLKADGHRVLIYSQMTRMIDLLEEYMWHRKHTYMRLDGSSKIADRRDMVANFQKRSDIFVFLLSTRAGGLGINLTAADTVIFYDSDWNPTVDQQAMDRAHRLGQTKQVTVYRLVCKGSIEERILQRAREKSEIQRMVISGGNLKPDVLKPKEVVSLLLDDEELERKFQQKQEERKQEDSSNYERKRKREKLAEKRGKRKKIEENLTIPATVGNMKQENDSVTGIDSIPPSPFSEHSVSSFAVAQDDTSSEGPLVVDDSSPSTTPVPPVNSSFSAQLGGENSGHINSPLTSGMVKKRGTGRGRGRPRGSGRRGSRGRGSTLATAAAELAAAQAGKSAAFAAYGYSLHGSLSPSGTLRGGVTRGSLHSPVRPSHQGQRSGKRHPTEAKMTISENSPNSLSPFAGFYVQNPQL